MASARRCKSFTGPGLCNANEREKYELPCPLSGDVGRDFRDVIDDLPIGYDVRSCCWRDTAVGRVRAFVISLVANGVSKTVT